MTSEQKQLAYLTRRVATLEKSLAAVLANQEQFRPLVAQIIANTSECPTSAPD